MTSVPSIVEKIVKKKPFLESALIEGLVNLSALARKLRPEVEKQAGRPVSDGAVVMSLNRLVPRLDLLSNVWLRKVMDNIGDIVVRSNLADLTYRNSVSLYRCQARLLDRVRQTKDAFCTFSQGADETTIVLSSALSSAAEEIFGGERKLAETAGLSSITIKLPAENSIYPGVYYYIFKELAWDSVNMVELISTTDEFTVVVRDDDIHRAFSILMELKHGASF